jgi:hypothetical protein
MSDQDTVAEGEARAAEIRRDVEAADARRSEEEVAAAEHEVEEAIEEQKKLSRRARRKAEKAEKAQQAAQAARAQADEEAAAARARADEAAARQTSSVSGAAVSSPGIGSETPPHAAAAASAQWPRPQAGAADSLTERPEVLIGAAFAGAFIFARVLKHIVD